MSHLTDALLAELVDGELHPSARDRALLHVWSCPHCRDLVEAERGARRALARAPDHQPGVALTARLLAMPLAAAEPEQPVQPPRRAYALLGVAALGAVTMSGAAAGGLFVLGGELQPGLDAAGISAVVAPVLPEDRDEDATTRIGDATARADAVAAAAGALDVSVNGALDRGEDVTADVIAWMREHGWSTPAMIPPALSVVDVRTSAEGVLVVELAGEGALVLVMERRGRLDPDLVSAGSPLELGGGEAYLVATAPWTAVVQSGEVAVAVVCHGPPGTGRQVLAAIPQSPPEMDGGARIGRGWATVTASLERVAGR